MSKVSILIPIYNVDKYLHQCLSSVVNQTLKAIEIICLNDGSTDNSLNIINEFAKTDSRIKIINKTNSGYGASMNLGLELASGEFIGIVESDDFIKPEMFEVLYNTAIEQNVNVVKSNFNYYWTETNKTKFSNLFPDWTLNNKINPLEEHFPFYLMPCIWSSIYKKEFIEKNKIRFLETPGASYQDTGFNFKCWATCESCYLIKDAFLFYRQDNAQSSINNPNKVFCVCDEYNEIDNFLKQNLDLKEKLEILKNRIQYGSYRWNFSRLKGNNKKDFLKQMSKEFKQTILDKKIDKTMFTKPEWNNYQYIAYYFNIKDRIKFILNQFFYFIFHTKYKKEYKKYYFLNIRILKIKIK